MFFSKNTPTHTRGQQSEALFSLANSYTPVQNKLLSKPHVTESNGQEQVCFLRYWPRFSNFQQFRWRWSNCKWSNILTHYFIKKKDVSHPRHTVLSNVKPWFRLGNIHSFVWSNLKWTSPNASQNTLNIANIKIQHTEVLQVPCNQIPCCFSRSCQLAYSTVTPCTHSVSFCLT